VHAIPKYIVQYDVKYGIVILILTKPEEISSNLADKFSTATAERTVAKFLVPDWEDIVDSGIGLSHRPTRLHRLAGRYDNPMPESTISHS
jgi:hypothetical protein